MARSRTYITIEGQFADGVLGTFRIIRGFATLQDLAEISAPYEMTSPVQGAPIQGHQRAIRPEHAEEIRKYLADGKLRFIPEIILSIRGDFHDELDVNQQPIGVTLSGAPGLEVHRRWKSPRIRTHQITVDRRKLQQLLVQDRRIRRIDGNHRLHLANDLSRDPRHPTKYLAPFCAVLLGPPGDANDDYVESMLFHTINSTALPLDSEHALTLVLGQPTGSGQTSDEEFAGSPALHLTRLLKGKVDALPAPQLQRLGATPATVIFDSARAMLAAKPDLKENRAGMADFATDLCAAVNEILARLPSTMPALCRADFFLELASLAWGEAKGEDHNERVNAAVRTLESLGRWLGRDGLQGIQEDGKRSLAEQLFELHRAVCDRIPKRIFLARWYPQARDGEELHKANLRKQMIDRSLDDLRAQDIELALDDPGTRAGSTFPIHKMMYDAIARNDIILVDLSGVRPNVCVEAGYALDHHKRGRLIFLFQPTAQTPSNPPYLKPPFDLAGFRYEQVSDSGEIPDKLKLHLIAILQDAANGM
jgi:hypothetical protein